MKKQKFILFITIFLLVIVTFIIILNNFSLPIVHLKDGKGSLNNFNEDESFILKGEWEVYHNNLVGTDNLDVSTLPKSKTTLPTKSTNAYELYGYISYRIILEDVPIGENLIMTLDSISGGYVVYFNREFVATNNKLHRGENRIDFDEKYLKYVTDSSTLEIIIETSNYELNATGLKNAPKISTLEEFEKSMLINFSFKIFIIGSLFFTAFFYLVIYGIRNIDKSSIYFSIFALCGVISLVTYKSTFSFVIENLLRINEKTMYYLHYTSLYLATLFLFLSIKTLFLKRKSNLLEIFLIISIALISVLPYALTIRNFLSSILFFNSINVIALIFILVWTIANLKKDSIYYTVIIILLLIISASIYDILIDENIIVKGEKISVIIFLICTILFGALSSFKRDIEISNVQEIVDLNKKIRDTEFSFLNSQIQSHFIYNTLNSVQALCNTNPNRAADLIEDFSMYLRTRLEFNKMPKLIDIEDELDNIRTYLNIEKERFGSRVNFEYDLKVGDFQIPPLSVQPLVENAVKHGISMKKTGGTVRISTRSDKSNLYIIVSDNGVGFDPELLNEKQRIGTENIRHRLSLHLGAKLTIESKLGEGTVSTISIPINDKDEKK